MLPSGPLHSTVGRPKLNSRRQFYRELDHSAHLCLQPTLKVTIGKRVSLSRCAGTVRGCQQQSHRLQSRLRVEWLIHLKALAVFGKVEQALAVIQTHSND